MRKSVYMVVGACVAGLAGCKAPQAAQDAEARKQSSEGRYQFAGKREYSNATEVYYLDTMKGRVCYGLITNDGKPDTNRCTDSMAFMEGE
jgi:hypothetical protein